MSVIFEFVKFLCKRTPEYPDETHLSDMVTSSHADAGYQIAVAVVRGRVTIA